MPDGTAGIKFGSKAHIGDAADLSICAWHSITQECIVNCTLKAELLGVVQHEELTALSGKQAVDVTNSAPEVAAAIDSICKLMERNLRIPAEAARFISESGGVILDSRQRRQYAGAELKEVVREWISVEDDDDILLEQLDEHLASIVSDVSTSVRVPEMHRSLFMLMWKNAMWTTLTWCCKGMMIGYSTPLDL